jgi:hypothetical protein
MAHAHPLAGTGPLATATSSVTARGTGPITPRAHRDVLNNSHRADPLGPAISSTSLLVDELIEDRADGGRRVQEESSNSVPGGRPTFFNSNLIAAVCGNACVGRKKGHKMVTRPRSLAEALPAVGAVVLLPPFAQ